MRWNVEVVEEFSALRDRDVTFVLVERVTRIGADSSQSEIFVGLDH